MLIRDATADDWPAIWSFMRRIVTAGETFSWPRDAVVETNERAVALWRSLGMEVVATLPEGFRHPVRGYVGLPIMYRLL